MYKFYYLGEVYIIWDNIFCCGTGDKAAMIDFYSQKSLKSVPEY
jgi:hypothetical protein